MQAASCPPPWVTTSGSHRVDKHGWETRYSFPPEGTERQREGGRTEETGGSILTGSQVGVDRFMGVVQQPRERLAALFINLEKSGKGLLVVKKMKMFRKVEEKNLKPFYACRHVRGPSSPAHPSPSVHPIPPCWGQEPSLEQASQRFLNI